MADSDSSDELFARWRKQMEASTKAWSKAVEDMSGQGHAPTTPPDPMQFWQQFMDPGAAPWARFQGAGPVEPAILEQWKRFLDDWIAAWSKALEQAMGTEAFAEALGKTLDQFLAVQGKAKKAAEKSNKATLEILGLPSRDQVIGLSRQLMDLEDRLEAIEDTLETLGSKKSTRVSSKRTSKTTKTGRQGKPSARRKTTKKRGTSKS